VADSCVYTASAGKDDGMEQVQRREMMYVARILRTLMAGGNMYTVEDILALPEGERAELIDGELFMMASPTWTHQQILAWLHLEIANYIIARKGKCQVGLAPFAVFLKNDERNYVEPDIGVICDEDKIDDQGVHGAPDWVIEIVSPSSIEMDYRKKLEAYQSAGVREYWIVDSLERMVTVYVFGDQADGGTGQHTIQKKTVYRFNERIPSGIVEGLVLDFGALQEFLA